MSVDELKALAVEMKTPNSYSDVKAQLVYDILDKQAEMSTVDSDAAPKRRRIASAPHDHVYSATQAGESERFDSARDERAAKKQIAEKARVEAAAAAEALVGAGEVVAEAPKRRRGRPTKAEVEAKKAAEEQEQKERAASTAAAEEENKANASNSGEAAPESKNADQPAAQQENTAAAQAQEEEDLPDFIVEQMKQQAANSEKEETGAALSSLSEHFRLRSEAAATGEQNATSAEP